MDRHEVTLPRKWGVTHVIFCALVVLLLVGRVGDAAAAELKIIDSLGLIRAVHEGDKPTEVVISVKDLSSAPAQLTLRQMDGLGADINADQHGKEFHFKNVQPGTWQIQVDEHKVGIATVRIVE